MLLSFLAARKRHVHVYQGGRALLPFSAQCAGVIKKNLASGKAADGGRVAIAVGNQGCVDVGPSRSAASCLAVAIRWNTLRTKKGPLAAHQSISR